MGQEKSLEQAPLRKLQLAELEMLKSLINFLDDNRIPYYAAGGTLLGAVRHKGFIPWDDDIDIGIPRNDYERFLNISPLLIDGKYEIDHFSRNPNRRLYCIALLDKKISYLENNSKKTVSHASIDILPIDGVPDSWLLRHLFILKVLFQRFLLVWKNIDNYALKKRTKVQKIILSFMNIIHLDHFIRRDRIFRNLDKLLRHQSAQNCNYIGTYMGAYKFREVVPKTYYGKGALYQFEDIMVKGPEQGILYLQHYYGDYMKMPPEDQRGHAVFSMIEEDMK